MHFDDQDTPRVRRFQRKVTLLSAGGTFLDGYDLTVIAVALPLIAEQWPLTAGTKSLITVAAIAGSFLGATLLGRLTDRLGRKAVYVIDLLAFVLFAVATAFSQTVWQLVLFRFLLGVGIGADYPISATLVSEFSSNKRRGRHGTSLAAMWFVGALAAYVVGLAVAPLGDWAWRALLLVGAVFALVVFLFRMTLPESPRWLASQGRHQEAVEVLRTVTGRTDITMVEAAPVARPPVSSLFVGAARRRTLFVCGFWFCYATAYYGISLYTPTILAPLTHGSRTLTIVGSGAVALIGLVGSIVGMNLVDGWGRRPLIITSFAGLTVALVVLALNSSPSLGFLIALFSVAVLFANSGGGILNFVYPTELFPTALRATGTGVATSVSRIGSILGVVVFPNLVAAWGTNVALWFFAAVGLAGLLICVSLAPETRGRTLEDITREERVRVAG
ncbi:MFS transporter [Nakamurella endophytica]|uniref:MFS transporter n=1 Tax=Nakamurella endophytica TaxID=1748367 RepID=A0A917WJD3_9ACTN|nr:MFS transporter [Nakamurella endophytica]GGM08322.1 MFS transporter [Nakamurella endophytica]